MGVLEGRALEGRGAGLRPRAGAELRPCRNQEETFDENVGG